MKDYESAYAVTHIKMLENKMLTRTDIDALISADSADSARRLLAERGYAAALSDELSSAWSAAYEVCPKDAPIDILLYENDFHNLKTALKAHAANTDCADMLLSPSIIPHNELLYAVKTADFSKLPEFIRNSAQEAYSLLTSTMDGQLLEIFLDKEYFSAALASAKISGDEFLIEYFKTAALLSDFKTAWRCAVSAKSRAFRENALNAPHESLYGSIADIRGYIADTFADADTSSLAAFERWCDNRLLSYAKRAKAKFFGFAPIAAFLLGKKSESQAVRIILACKDNGIGEDIIRERLRDIYV